MSTRRKEKIRAGRRTLEVASLDKVFYPETGFTKGDVISFYRDVSSALIPHLKNRPATFKRYPDGVTGGFFYEKRCPPYAPDWMKTVGIVRQRDKKEINYCLLNDVAALLWSANLANLELHTSLARANHLDRPVALVFDLDPGPGVDVLGCAEVAGWLREIFADIELESFVKTSGSKGLHFFVPLNNTTTYEQSGPFAHSIAQMLEQQHPDRIVTKMSKELRPGKIFIDWSQNALHKTTVSVYSLRARERPTVSTPVKWNELERALKKDEAQLLVFEVGDVLKRIDKHGDLFEPVLKLKQKLPAL
jgi:bifunctional non-homologous end joining protein LigD